MLKIAIVSRPENGSPKVLANCLFDALKPTSHKVEKFYRLNTFKRLVKYKKVKHKYSYPLWLVYKARHFFKDQLLLKQLKKFDLIIITDCTPMAFLEETYNIERLKMLMDPIPVFYYAVFYLGNGPTMIDYLKQHNQPGLERFDWHLSVSAVTEVRQAEGDHWTQIGINLKSTGLKPAPKSSFLAVVDFAQPGYEEVRNTQIRALKELEIPFISLDRPYSISEIRAIYKKAAIYFMQSYESFGLPIAECLCGGSYIFTANSGWPMSWRLDEKPEIHGPGTLPECFVLYDDLEDLKRKIQEIKHGYDLENSPQKVFDIFYKHYPSYYEGKPKILEEILKRVEQKGPITVNNLHNQTLTK